MDIEEAIGMLKASPLESLVKSPFITLFLSLVSGYLIRTPFSGLAFSRPPNIVIDVFPVEDVYLSQACTSSSMDLTTICVLVGGVTTCTPERNDSLVRAGELKYLSI